MPFTLIKGTFHAVGYSPDGDSVRFQAENNDNWALLDGPFVELNARGHAQLRFEAIDTLETHYQGHHQPLELAKVALTFLLAELGIDEVEFDEHGTRIASANDGKSGYILSRQTERYRRPVAFLFAGESEANDGERVFLDAEELKSSVNYKSALAGLAYPTYYTGLFSDLRQAVTCAVEQARQDKKGVWPQDRTPGFMVSDLNSITDEFVILPKLFRRIINFMGDGGSIDSFKNYLETYPEPVVELGTGRFTNLDTFVEVTNKEVRLTAKPENLVFVEK